MAKKSVPDITESEDELISRAQVAVSQCNWSVGECAYKWTEKYARGRTDADFGVLVGLSPDQVFQRRRVWETFADVHAVYARSQVVALLRGPELGRRSGMPAMGRGKPGHRG